MGGKHYATDQEYMAAHTGPANERGCTLWRLSKTTKMGYGNAYRSRCGQTYAHRLAYETFVGPIPRWKKVLHTCDTPLCVNVEHLYLGDDGDNARDRTDRGRCPPPPVKQCYLNPDEIRAQLARGASKQELADIHGVALNTIYTTLKRK